MAESPERALLRRLVEKLDVIIPKVDGIIAFNSIRSGRETYDGPNIVEEMREAKALLVERCIDCGEPIEPDDRTATGPTGVMHFRCFKRGTSFGRQITVPVGEHAYCTDEHCVCMCTACVDARR